jgi:hypothetical protein
MAECLIKEQLYLLTFTQEGQVSEINFDFSKKQTSKLRGLSPRANYTDRANAASPRS